MKVVDVNPCLKLRPWQRKALRLIHSHRGAFIEAHRRSGKSYLLSVLLFQRLMLPVSTPESCLLIAPQLRQSWRHHRDAIISLARTFEDQYGVPVPLDIQAAEHRIVGPFGSTSCFASLQRSPEFLRGAKWRMVCLDEIGEIKSGFDTLFSSILPALADRVLSELLLCGTPPSGHAVFRSALKAAKAMGLPHLRIPLSETNLLTPQQVQQVKQASMAIFLREFQLEYSSETSLDLYTSQAVLQNIVADVGPEKSTIFENDLDVVGLDIGFSDRSILAHRRQNRLEGIFDLLDSDDYTGGKDKVDLLGKVARRAVNYCLQNNVFKLNFDASGPLGTLLDSALRNEIEQSSYHRTRLIELNPVRPGNPVPGTGCRVLRSLLFRHTQQWLQDPHTWFKAWEDDVEMYDDLLQEIEATSVTNLSPYDVLPKIKLSKLINRSPDCLDSLTYTFHGLDLKESGDIVKILTAEEYWRKVGAE